MDPTLDQARVRTILEHPGDLPWRLQDVGLLALRLDDERRFRLHVWAPEARVGEPPIHDHPYDFTSTIVVGEVTDTRYVEDDAGDVYRRERYSLDDEDDRRSDRIRLAGTSAAFGPGDHYHMRAHELHDSRPRPGTVTVIECDWLERPELTVCLRPDAPWVSGRARPATRDEVSRITATALARLDASPVPAP